MFGKTVISTGSCSADSVSSALYATVLRSDDFGTMKVPVYKIPEISGSEPFRVYRIVPPGYVVSRVTAADPRALTEFERIKRPSAITAKLLAGKTLPTKDPGPTMFVVPKLSCPNVAVT